MTNAVERMMKEKNKGNIWKGKTWKEIFDKLPLSNGSWWIEKVFITGENLLSDGVFSHYQLKCEEGFKNHIPNTFNNYIEKNFNTNEKYIINAKVKEILES